MEIIIGAPTEENKHEMWHAMCHPRDVPIVVIVLRLGDHLGIVAGCQPVSYNTLHDLLCLWKHVHKFFSNKHYRDDMTFRAFIFRNVCSSIVLFFFFFLWFDILWQLNNRRMRLRFVHTICILLLRSSSRKHVSSRFSGITIMI